MSQHPAPLICLHIDQGVVASAANQISHLRCDVQSLSKNLCYACLECRFVSNLSGLKTHHSSTNHSVGVRFSSPYGIYCLQCEDFQFSQGFDNLLNSQGLKDKNKKQKISNINMNGISKGLCNMGSTCKTFSIYNNIYNNNNNNNKAS